MFSKSVRMVTVLFTLIAVLAVSFANVSTVSAAGGTAGYDVKSGDNLTKIADRFDISVDQLLSVNPLITDPNLILSGQVITLPVGRGEGTLKPAVGRFFRWQLEQNGNKLTGEERFYLVRGGDSLTRIAKSYGLTLEKLITANPQIEDVNLLFGGELIRIPKGVSETAPSFYKTLPDPSTSR